MKEVYNMDAATLNTDAKIILVPIEMPVPTPSKAVAVGFVMLTAVAVAACAIAYSAGQDDGAAKAQAESMKKMDDMVRDLKARHQKEIDEAVTAALKDRPGPRSVTT